MITRFAYIKLLTFDPELTASFFKKSYGFKISKSTINNGDNNITLQSNDIVFHLISYPNQHSRYASGDRVLEVGFYVNQLEYIVKQINSPHSLCSKIFDNIRINSEEVVLETPNELRFSFTKDPSPQSEQNLQQDQFQFSEIDHLAICLPKDSINVWSFILSSLLELEQCFEQKVVTQTSGMDSLVLRSKENKKVKLVLVEPLSEKSNCQLNNYLSNNGGLGVQHIAFLTKDIYSAAKYLENKGVEMLKIPKLFYETISASIEKEQLDKRVLSDYNIIFDLDGPGYLLQCFTKPIPNSTVTFIEIIARYGSDLFGMKNIHTLFEALESKIAVA